MKRSPVVPVAVVLAVLSLVGPLMMLVGMVIGGNPLDGVAGNEPTNTTTQTALTLGGLVATLFMSGPLLLIALMAYIRYRRGDPRAKWLPRIVLCGPALLVALLLVSVVFLGR